MLASARIGMSEEQYGVSWARKAAWSGGSSWK